MCVYVPPVVLLPRSDVCRREERNPGASRLRLYEGMSGLREALGCCIERRDTVVVEQENSRIHMRRACILVRCTSVPTLICSNTFCARLMAAVCALVAECAYASFVVDVRRRNVGAEAVRL